MTRRVVVVKSPDKRIFEEAVFFLRDKPDKGVTSDEVLAQAQAVATNFINQRRYKNRFYHNSIFWSVCGAAAASIIWAIGVFLIK